jgi:hypothetical protein
MSSQNHRFCCDRSLTDLLRNLATEETLVSLDTFYPYTHFRSSSTDKTSPRTTNSVLPRLLINLTLAESAVSMLTILSSFYATTTLSQTLKTVVKLLLNTTKTKTVASPSVNSAKSSFLPQTLTSALLPNRDVLVATILPALLFPSTASTWLFVSLKRRWHFSVTVTRVSASSSLVLTSSRFVHSTKSPVVSTLSVSPTS